MKTYNLKEIKLINELIWLLPELHAGEADGVKEEEGDGRHQVQVGHVLVVHTVHRTALTKLSIKGQSHASLTYTITTFIDQTFNCSKFHLSRLLIFNFSCSGFVMYCWVCTTSLHESSGSKSTSNKASVREDW
jgi:hypothetical protein